MVVFKDMCFCGNGECTKRSKCARALENYREEDKKDRYFSFSVFDCENKTDMYRPLSKEV